MRLRTIWTIHAMSLAERLRRTRDWGAWKVAGTLPKRIRYTTTLRELSKATMESPNVPATKLEDILKNLDAPKNFS